MSKVAFLKRRNSKQREAYAQNRYLMGLAKSAFERNPYRIIRTDLATDEETEITKREFENEMSFNCKLFFSKIPRFALYTGEFDLIWREMERNTQFHTQQHCYEIKYLNGCSKTVH